MDTKNIMIVGVGGQGTLLTSRILGGVMMDAGYEVKMSEVHGMAQRGGSVVTFVRYGEEVFEPIVEEGCADVLIAFERLEALRYAHFLKKDGVLISDNALQGDDIIQSKYAIQRIDRTIHKRMREYLFNLTHNEELVTSIIPIGDGITISSKK